MKDEHGAFGLPVIVRDDRGQDVGRASVGVNHLIGLRPVDAEPHNDGDKDRLKLRHCGASSQKPPIEPKQRKSKQSRVSIHSVAHRRSNLVVREAQRHLCVDHIAIDQRQRAPIQVPRASAVFILNLVPNDCGSTKGCKKRHN